MSRHRHYRNLDIDEELDDDALSDGGEDELTQEQIAQLEGGLVRARAILGSEYESGLSDQAVKDAIWDQWFDVDKAVRWLLDQQDRKTIAKDREDQTSSKELPPLPNDDPEDEEYFQYHSSVSPREIMIQSQVGPDDRPRVPLIVLALQQQHQQNQLDKQDVSDTSSTFTSRSRSRLTTITERTERTDASGHWPSRQQLVALNNPRPLSTISSDTSYGQIIPNAINSSPQNPDLIPPSPSPSAVLRLSQYDAPPSMVTSESHSSLTPLPRPPSASVPPINTIPDIPNHTSKSSKQPIAPLANPPTAVPRSMSPPGSPKKSKLSMLASSRASITSTKSSRSYTLDSSSVVTYPALRPSPSSEVGISPVPSAAPSKPLSSTSSHVRRAIQSALNQEAVDKATTTKDSRGSAALLSSSSGSTTPRIQSPVASSAGSATPRPQSLASVPPGTPPESERGSAARFLESKPDSRQPSKLTLLAQAKAQAHQGPWMPKPKPKQKQQMELSSPGGLLPKPHTEHLTPIANGGSATLAITTSYQSLHSLSSPSRSSGPLHAPPPDDMSPTSSPISKRNSPIKDAKRSKLAMKIKSAREKPDFDSSPVEDSPVSSPTPPLFLPKATRSRASPSAFASILIDEPLTYPEDKNYRKSKDRVHQRDGYVSPEKGKHKSHRNGSQSSRSDTAPTFTFDVPSPDDVVLNARRGTSLAQHRRESAAKKREKVHVAGKKLAQGKSGTISVSAVRVTPPTPSARGSKKAAASTPKKAEVGTGPSTPLQTLDQRHIDIIGLNLYSNNDDAVEEAPKMSFAKEKLLEEAQRTLDARGENDKRGVSLVVIGHVDAGKSTLMGRLLYELGRVDEKTRIANERGSSKLGKSSFSWAWQLDGTNEERERGITMDIALQSLSTPHRQVTILDAPGHKDFIPNMISGASQADCALLVVDAATGEFEAGFDRGGQTREHLLLVRSLGVSQVIVAVNKLDQVEWEKGRYTHICNLLRPFLIQSGFHPSKSKFVPVGAIQGVNLATRDNPDAKNLRLWYNGPTLVDLLDRLEPPTRDITAPLRLPISNVFRGQGSGIGVAGRLCGGVVQVGERLRILPGDETAVVKSINVEEEPVPWAAAGSNATIYLTAVDPIHVGIGSVLCPPADIIPVATVFTARIIVFDVIVPITAGASVELYHHSKDVPATISKLVSTLDRANGAIIKRNPRALTKGTSAEVQITLRTNAFSGSSGARPIPLEPFASNKDMGRVLIRRAGETISAGIVLEIIS